MSLSFSSKASISDGMGVHKCIRYGQLACFGRYIKVLKQHMLLQGADDVYYSRTMQSHILQLLQQHGLVVEESGC